MKRLTTEEFIKKAKEIHGEKYDYSHSVYIKGRELITIFCPNHGNFKQLAYSHLGGKGCKKCGNVNISNSKQYSSEIFIKKAKEIHGEKYDYSIINYVGSTYPVEIKCIKCNNVFKQRPNDHLQNHGCNFCGGTKKSTKENFIKSSSIIHENKYEYSNVVYKNNTTKVNILCKIHGIFLQTPHGHLSGKGCPICSHSVSKMETEFLNYINIHKNNRQIKIKNFIVDGIDYDTNTVYEFLGDYWHGNLNIYNSNKIHSLMKISFKKLNEITFNRLKNIKSNGYNIKYIWEYDWKKWKLNKNIPILIKEY